MRCHRTEIVINFLCSGCCMCVCVRVDFFHSHFVRVVSVRQINHKSSTDEVTHNFIFRRSTCSFCHENCMSAGCGTLNRLTFIAVRIRFKCSQFTETQINVVASSNRVVATATTIAASWWWFTFQFRGVHEELNSAITFIWNSHCFRWQ